MAATFDDKVEALRRLREKRQQRTAQAEAKDASAPEAASARDTAAAGPASAGPSTEEPAADTAAGAVAAGHAAASPRPDPCDKGGPGEADGLFCAGHCLERGIHGCDADPGAAAALYREAAEQGHAVAQWRLGELCEFGRGVPQSDAEAARWYGKAAEAGNTPARVNLALFLEAGRGGLARDDAAAARLHLLAAEADNALAQYCAARCLLEGRGVELDWEAARTWLRRSAAAGFGPAADELRLLDSDGGHVSTRDATAAARCGARGGGGASDSESNSAGPDPSLMGLAGRLAEQLRHLSQEDAEAMLEDLMRDISPDQLEAELYDDPDDDAGDHGAVTRPAGRSASALAGGGGYPVWASPLGAPAA